MQSSDRDPELPPTYRRDKAETQTRLRVEAQRRAGNRNVAALETRIQTLEGRILAAHTPDEARRLLRP